MSIYTSTQSNGNVQQNPTCVESCITKEFSISTLFSPTMFDPDANSVRLRAHLCTAVGSMGRKPCVRICSREREGLYHGNILLAHLCTAVLMGSMRRTLCSKLFMMRALRSIYNMYIGNVQQNPLCVESCVTKADSDGSEKK